MLASITPLGERSRGFSWRVTAGAMAIGAIGAGALAGAAAGGLGTLLPGGTAWRSGIVAALLVGAALLDAPGGRLRLPSSHRQVNEDWLARYRGWVYGFGFGAQLGVGVATIVTTAAIYALGLLAMLGAGVAGGALIGGSFGAIRGLSLLPARRVHDVPALIALHERIDRLEAPVRRASWLLELLALATAIGWLVW